MRDTDPTTSVTPDEQTQESAAERTSGSHMPAWKRLALLAAGAAAFNQLTACAPVHATPEAPTPGPTPADTRTQGTTTSPSAEAPTPAERKPTTIKELLAATPEQIAPMTVEEIAKALGLPKELQPQALVDDSVEAFREKFSYNPDKVTKKNFAQVYAAHENAGRLWAASEHPEDEDVDGKIDALYEKQRGQAPQKNSPDYQEFSDGIKSIITATRLVKLAGIDNNPPAANFYVFDTAKADLTMNNFGANVKTNHYVLTMPAISVSKMPDMIKQYITPDDPNAATWYQEGVYTVGAQIQDESAKFGRWIVPTTSPEFGRTV